MNGTPPSILQLPPEGHKEQKERKREKHRKKRHLGQQPEFANEGRAKVFLLLLPLVLLIGGETRAASLRSPPLLTTRTE